MGWSLRKSFKLGPTRINLSSRGIGYSVGVRGFRVGTSARGKGYLRAGRGMLRYQAALGGGGSTPSRASGGTSSTPSSSGAGCLILLGTGAMFAAVVAALNLASSANMTQRDAYLALAVLGALSVLAMWAIVRTHRKMRRRRENVAAYLTAANALIGNATPTEHDASAVISLRAADLGPLPDTLANDLETGYCRAVADSVADLVVTSAERARLSILAHGLGLSGDLVKRANLNGFIQGFSTIVSDHKLTAEEEAQLTDLREAFEVPDIAVQAHLAQADQLRRAREVGEAPLVAMPSAVKLRKDEECYYATSVREMKERVARSWIEGGERYTERELQEVRAGTLHVTNRRLLLVADGATTIKTDAILSVSLDVQEDGVSVVNLMVDGRKTPYYFSFPEPFVTLAYIERVWAQA